MFDVCCMRLFFDVCGLSIAGQFSVAFFIYLCVVCYVLFVV